MGEKQPDKTLITNGPKNGVRSTIWNDGGAYLQFWRSVFERNAPSFIEQIESLPEIQIGQGNTTREISDELLDILTEAYKAAAK